MSETRRDRQLFSQQFFLTTFTNRRSGRMNKSSSVRHMGLNSFRPNDRLSTPPMMNCLIFMQPLQPHLLHLLLQVADDPEKNCPLRGTQLNSEVPCEEAQMEFDRLPISHAWAVRFFPAPEPSVLQSNSADDKHERVYHLGCNQHAIVWTRIRADMGKRFFPPLGP